MSFPDGWEITDEEKRVIMSGKATELSDKEASDQVTNASGEVAQAITSTSANPVPLQERSSDAGLKKSERPHKGFGHTNFDNTAPNPNERKHVGDDPLGEENLKALEDHQAKAGK